MPWLEEAISRTHDRAAFDCGDPAPHDFLRRNARQSHDDGAAKTFLAIDSETRAVIGFYSLAPACIAYDRTPDAARRGLARHEVAGFRLARLAVHAAWQGRGIGGQFLLAAGRRCIAVAAEVGGTILVIDAKSDRAAAWYAAHGAMPLVDSARTLVLPLATIAAALKHAETQ